MSSKSSDSSTRMPLSIRSIAPFSPKASISSALREARYSNRAESCAGQDCVLGQRQSASPSFCGANFVPHAGQFSGKVHSYSLPSRCSRTGPRTSGIISPALRIMTVSPMSTPLRLTSDWLCRVAISTVDPETKTGSITAYGVTRPVRPTPTSMFLSFVVTSSGGYL